MQLRTSEVEAVNKSTVKQVLYHQIDEMSENKKHMPDTVHANCELIVSDWSLKVINKLRVDILQAKQVLCGSYLPTHETCQNSVRGLAIITNMHCEECFRRCRLYRQVLCLRKTST